MHVPCLSYHIFSLRVAADKGHKYTGTSDGVRWISTLGRIYFSCQYGDSVSSTRTARMHLLTRLPMLPLRLGRCPMTETPPLTSTISTSHAHAHEGALRKTTKQMNVTLVGKMDECKCCSLAKGIGMSIPSETSKRAVKRLFRVFVDFGGKKHVKSIGGRKYPMIIREDYSRYTWMYFISHKSNAADTCAKFLSDIRLEGIPSEVVVIRSDDGGEFSEGNFGKLCRKRKIKQECTTSADSHKYNGFAKQGLALIESVALAVRIQASELFPGFNVPEGLSLWTEAMNWACDAYNRTATVGNSSNLSPYEMLWRTFADESDSLLQARVLQVLTHE